MAVYSLLFLVIILNLLGLSFSSFALTFFFLHPSSSFILSSFFTLHSFYPHFFSFILCFIQWCSRSLASCSDSSWLFKLNWPSLTFQLPIESPHLAWEDRHSSTDNQRPLLVIHTDWSVIYLFNQWWVLTCWQHCELNWHPELQRLTLFGSRRQRPVKKLVVIHDHDSPCNIFNQQWVLTRWQPCELDWHSKYSPHNSFSSRQQVLKHRHWNTTYNNHHLIVQYRQLECDDHHPAIEVQYTW